LSQRALLQIPWLHEFPWSCWESWWFSSPLRSLLLLSTVYDLKLTDHSDAWKIDWIRDRERWIGKIYLITTKFTSQRQARVTTVTSLYKKWWKTKSRPNQERNRFKTWLSPKTKWLPSARKINSSELNNFTTVATTWRVNIFKKTEKSIRRSLPNWTPKTTWPLASSREAPSPKVGIR